MQRPPLMRVGPQSLGREADALRTYTLALDVRRKHVGPDHVSLSEPLLKVAAVKKVRWSTSGLCLADAAAMHNRRLVGQTRRYWIWKRRFACAG